MKSSVKLGMIMITMMLAFSGFSPVIANADASHNIEKIERFIEQQKEISNIPGLSVVIVEKGKTVYQKGFGYADIKTKKPVTNQTLFEIGSTSKAFTGLAILQLEKEGLLQRTDDVQKYIPWLKLTYNGAPLSITIDQLLHHTSGIPSNTITQIPESNAENALELTVRTLLDQSLNRKPGSSFEYATINYDVLGLVIETVSKKPYDVYMKEQILEPIGMNSSFAGRHQVQSAEFASGHKYGFMQAQAYTAPIYRGNIPAGYLVSNTNDIAKWLNLQLGYDPRNAFGQELIEASHIPDQTVAPFDQDTYYASGWGVMKKHDQRYVFHAGENPNFTSYFIIQPDEQVGVAILSNMNTTFTRAIGQGVMELWEGRSVNTNHTDGYQKIDKIVSIMCIVGGGFGVLFILSTLILVRKLVSRQRIWTSPSVKRILLLLIHTVIVAAILIVAIKLPDILFGGVPWSFIQVWGPTSMTVFLYGVIIVSIIYYMLGLLLGLTKKVK